MKSRSKLDIAEKDKAKPEASLLERLETYFKTVFIIISIEKELDQEIKRFRKAAQMSAVTALKKRRPRYERAGKKTPKSSKSSSSRSLPKILTTTAQPQQSITVFNFYSETRSQLARIERVIWRCLIPDQKDRAMIAKLDLQNDMDKADACHRLIKEAPASQYAKLQTLRVPLLNNFLARLEEDIQQKEMQLIKIQVRAMAAKLKRTSTVLKNFGSRRTATAQAIARLEQRVIEREAKLAEALDLDGCIIKLSPTIFEGMEQKVAASEVLAKASFESIVSLPPIVTKSLTAAQVKKAVPEFALASERLTKSCDNLADAEVEVKQLISIWQEQATVWQARQSEAEQARHTNWAKQAEHRVKAAQDTIMYLEQSLEFLKSIKEPIQQRLDEINLVCAKLTDRLAEIEQAKEKQTNVN